MPQAAEQEPQQTSALETQPSHVTASETDQYTKDNELEPAVKTSVAIAIEEDHQNNTGRNSGEIFQATPNPFLPRYSVEPCNSILADDEEVFGLHSVPLLPDYSRRHFPVETSAVTGTNGSIASSYEHNMHSVREHGREESPQTSAVGAQSSQTTVGHRDCRNESFDRDYQRNERRHSEEDSQATPQPENPFLPRYSADTYNTAEHIPKWMDPVATLTDCTSDGRSYYDEHNDFRLEIPEGAIPEGERVIIDIGVALYGPCQYLTGLRPVSPVFWVCIRGRENFRFLKPVKITIEHCLRLDRDTDTHSLGLIFLKAGHTLNSAGKYELQSADGAHDFQSDLSHGTLTTDHFCLLCIKAKDDHETAMRNGYFLIPAYVNPIIARENQVMQFFITLKLKCCIETVKIRCRDKGYEYNFLSFYFNLEDNADGDLTIKYTCTEPEMWIICLQSSRTVSIPVIATNHL